jgi:methylphosphotriester-DNA--protein-cysteine methyltransferase
VNSADIAEWLVCSGIRSRYSQAGAVLLDFRRGHYYTLNRFAARAWLVIEASPSGIALEDIVDALETHFEVQREELEREAAQCLADLQRESLARRRLAASEESSADHLSSSLRGEGGVREPEGRQVMIHEQQFVQRFETAGSLANQLFQQGVARHVDWRAKKLKDFIDNTPDKIRGNLHEVCGQLQLSLSDRQARRLFKDSTGISIREYARKRRLVLAAQQLQDTGEPIKVIATDAGYQTLQGFEKGFYDMFRLTPVEFRRMWQQSQVLA